ncbi:MAG: hypothetical protein GKB99_02710 [Methanocellales archaeon]|nr:hypothetical protein [Methanocellales archaeon]
MKHVKAALKEKKRIIATLSVILLVAFGVSLIYLDFGLFRYESAVASQAGTFSVMEPEPALSGVVYLYVEGNDPLNRALEAELKQELRGIYSEVQSFGNLKQQFDGPVVAVYVIREDHFYTPVYAKTDVEVLYLFSNSGSTSYFRDFFMAKFGAPSPVVHLSSTEGPQLVVKTDITVRTSMKGFFSLEASRQLLAEKVANEVVTKLDDMR